MDKFVAALAFLATLLVFASAQSCSFTDANNCYYDLSGLTIPVSTDSTYYQYSVATGEGTGTYVLNICDSVGSETEPGAAVVQTSADGTLYSAGQAAGFVIGSYTGETVAQLCPGVQITYINGDDCKVAARSTQINIGCNQDYAVGDSNIITNIDETNCLYNVQAYSAAACGVQLTAVVTPSITPSDVPSISVTETATETATETPSVTASLSIESTPSDSSQSASISESLSLSVAASVTPSVSASISLSPSAQSPTPTPTITTSTTTSVSITQSQYATVSTTNTATASISVTPSVTPVASPSPTSTGGDNGWIWWLVGAIAIVVIVVAIGVAVFLVYKKKQQSYDSIGYE